MKGLRNKSHILFS